MLDWSSFKHPYLSLILVQLPSDNRLDSLSSGWETSINSALEWIYDVHHELYKADPNLTCRFIFDPEDHSSSSSSQTGHYVDQALKQYVNEFRRDNMVGAEPFATGVTLGVQSWKQAYGLVADYPIKSKLTADAFIQQYNQGNAGTINKNAQIIKKTGTD